MIFKMQEIKKPSKKPLVYYYLLTLAILLLLNATLFPSMNKSRIENVTYDVFMSMTDEKQIDQVEIRDDQILFTDKEGKIYETVATEDAGRTQRLYDSGAKFQQIDTQPSAMATLLMNWVLPLVPFMLIGYFLNRRMQKAMALLKKGKLRVYEVAEAVGYKDITYFSGTFKKLTGMSPTEYQNANF